MRCPTHFSHWSALIFLYSAWAVRNVQNSSTNLAYSSRGRWEGEQLQAVRCSGREAVNQSCRPASRRGNATLKGKHSINLSAARLRAVSNAA